MPSWCGALFKKKKHRDVTFLPLPDNVILVEKTKDL
jgi:hypothetical protein